MATPELDRILERARQSRAALRRELLARPVSTASVEHRLGLGLLPGAKVFDRVTGLEGEVISGTRETILVQPTERRDG